ncbi:MAG: hypothetical protein KIT56_10220, partial [Gammaproteobacteria bacterium]|nr:hypothetical protein [Gammaproteobacteria bacterium]
MSNSRLKGRQRKNKNKEIPMLKNLDFMSAVIQLTQSLGITNSGNRVNGKKNLLEQFLEVKHQSEYESLFSFVSVWLLNNFKLANQAASDEALYVYVLLNLMIEKKEIDWNISRLGEAISYVNNSNIKHVLLLIRVYICVNNATMERLIHAENDIELLKDSCHPMILESVKKFKDKLSSFSLASGKEKVSETKGLSEAEECLFQIQENIRKKNYFLAYQKANEFFTSDKLEPSDLKSRIGEFYYLYVFLIIYFHATLTSGGNLELKKTLHDNRINGGNLRFELNNIMEMGVEESKEKHLFWNKLIEELTSTFVQENNNIAALNSLNLVRECYDDLIAEDREIGFITSWALFTRKEKDLKKENMAKDKEVLSLSADLLNDIVTLNREPFAQSKILEGSDQKKWEDSILLFHEFNKANSVNDYSHVLVKSRTLLLHFDSSKSNSGALDIAFYLYDLCHFSLNCKKVLPVILDEGIDYCVNSEVKYVLILIKSYIHLLDKQYAEYAMSMAQLQNKEDWENSIAQKYQGLLEKIMLFSQQWQQDNVKVDTQSNNVSNVVILAVAHPRLELVNKSLSECEYIKAYNSAKSFINEATEGDISCYFILCQIYLMKIYLSFLHDKSLRDKVGLDEETCFNNLLRVVHDALQSSPKKHKTWMDLIGYITSDHHDDYDKMMCFLSTLNRIINHEFISSSYYCVTANNLMRRLHDDFSIKNQKQMKELKRKNKEELLRKEKNNQAIRRLQNQVSKQKRKEASTERMENNKKNKILEQNENISPQTSDAAVDGQNVSEKENAKENTGKREKRKARKKEKKELLRQKMAEHKRKQQEESAQVMDAKVIVLPNQFVSAESSVKTKMEYGTPPQPMLSVKDEDEPYQVMPTPAQIAEQRAKDKKMQRHAENVSLFLQGTRCLDCINKLYLISKQLCQFGVALTLSGSFATRLGVLLYHSRPEVCKDITFNDIDAYIDTHDLDQFKVVINTLTQEGFLQTTATESNHPRKGIKINAYVKLELIIQNIKIDITVRGIGYKTFEFIPFTSGRVVFSEVEDIPAIDMNSVFFDQTEKNMLFALSVLSNDEFKEACEHLNFSLHPPRMQSNDEAGTTSYCFRIFKLIEKYDDLIKITNFHDAMKSAEIYFTSQVKRDDFSNKINSAYYELFDFFKNHAVPQINSHRYIEMLCRTLLSRHIPDEKIKKDAPEILLFPIMRKLYCMNVFTLDIKIFRRQIDMLINHFIYEYKVTLNPQSLLKVNTEGFINMMCANLKRIVDDTFYYNKNQS